MSPGGPEPEAALRKVSRRTAGNGGLANHPALGKDAPYMTRRQIESAIESGVPFALRMADGKEYVVPHSDYIWLPPNASYVLVHKDDGHFKVLPGLRSKGTERSGKQKHTNG